MFNDHLKSNESEIVIALIQMVIHPLHPIDRLNDRNDLVYEYNKKCKIHLSGTINDRVLLGTIHISVPLSHGIGVCF